MRCLLWIALLASTAAAADGREAIYGTWGTEAQCSGQPIKPGGTVLAEPFEISADWLGHGRVWCKLEWFPVEPREGGLFTGARALCGEDSVRSYFLGIGLSGEALTLRWNFGFSNGPLKRCPSS